MKLEKVLLRWYKSFNIRYRFDDPDRYKDELHPWNSIAIGEELADHYPFIEIPIEQDITTIVGGNESGKSHLLDAICKVANGTGINGDSFSQSDICRYRSNPVDSVDTMPNIGLQFRITVVEARELENILSIAKIDHRESLTFILGGTVESVVGYLYSGELAAELEEAEITALREKFPVIRYIDAHAALPDHIGLGELLSANSESSEAADFVTLDPYNTQMALKSLLQSPIPQQDAHPIGPIRSTIEQIRKDVIEQPKIPPDDAKLASTLFTDLLEIDHDTLKRVLDQPVANRGHYQTYIDRWNDLVSERLDLSEYWQQDDLAKLTIQYRAHTLYFDISDKTGQTYTFKERSSGLKYFMSYFIQAKALEKVGKDSNVLILMDEPDSFLSILGQKNLLSIFESLAGYQSILENSQLVYTTHSPFLLNRNFPRRIRVVTKEEAEEGTQFSGRASSRRYEPVRSALGIDCAQTLFMGNTNLVLEGITDQYLINETVRLLSTPNNMHNVLDLNKVSVVSADSVNNVERLLSISQWRDEPVPATVVLIDGDIAGKNVALDITGQSNGHKKLIDKEFVLVLSDSLHESLNGVVIETIEDIVPRSLYGLAFQQYVERWHSAVSESIDIEKSIEQDSAPVGNVEFIKNLCKSTTGLDSDFDKMGIIQCLIGMIDDELRLNNGIVEKTPKDVQIFIDRVSQLFKELKEKITASQDKAKSQSLATSIKRLVREFLRTRSDGVKVLDLQRHLVRLQNEVSSGAEHEKKLAGVLVKIKQAVDAHEVDKKLSVTGEDWKSIYTALESVKRNPLSPKVDQKFV